MPNQLERKLFAIHSSIAEIKRNMIDCVNVKHYEEYEKQLEELEKARLEVLKQMECIYD